MGPALCSSWYDNSLSKEARKWLPWYQAGHFDWTEKGTVFLWFDKKQSVLTVSGQEGQHRNKELKNRFSREYRKGASCLLQKLDWLTGWGVIRSAGDLWLPAGPTDPSCSCWGLRVCQVLVTEQKPCLHGAYILMVSSSTKKKNNEQGNGGVGRNYFR